MYKELIRQLRRIGTDNHCCFGCGFEHNCGIHGCAVINEAIRLLENRAAADTKDCSGLLEE